MSGSAKLDCLTDLIAAQVVAKTSWTLTIMTQNVVTAAVLVCNVLKGCT